MQKSNTVRVEPFDFAFHPVRPERSGAESKDERYAQDGCAKRSRNMNVAPHWFDTSTPRHRAQFILSMSKGSVRTGLS